MRLLSGSFGLSLTALIFGLSAEVYAQNVPSAGDIVRQNRVEPEIGRGVEAPIPSIGGAPLELPLKALPKGQMKIKVNSFKITGNRVLDVETLLEQISEQAGKELSLAEIEAVALKLTRYYRSRGYFVARVYVPAQKVEGNEITLRAVEGNYGRFHLKNKSIVRDDIVQDILDDVKDKDIVSLDTLERAMLIINDTPGSKVTQADVMPGEKTGTSDFAIGTEATPSYNGFLMLDNFGSRYTGKHRLSFNHDINSVTGRGDRLSISGMGAKEGPLVNARVAYSALLMPNGLRGELAIAHTRYELGSTYKSLDAIGQATIVEAGLSYPIRRTTLQSLEANMNFTYKDLMDKIRSTDTQTPKSIVMGNIGLTLRDERNLFGLSGLSVINIGGGFGYLNIDNAEARLLDKLGARTQGNFSKFVASVSRVTNLPLEFSLGLSARYMRSLQDKNLDASERMSISGLGGVMAYPSGELSGTHAGFLRAELARKLFTINEFTSGGSLFAEWGQAKAADIVSSSDKLRTLSGIGVGFNANYKGAVLKTYFTHRLSDKAAISERTSRNRVLFQLGWVY